MNIHKTILQLKRVCDEKGIFYRLSQTSIIIQISDFKMLYEKTSSYHTELKLQLAVQQRYSIKNFNFQEIIDIKGKTAFYLNVKDFIIKHPNPPYEIIISLK